MTWTWNPSDRATCAPTPGSPDILIDGSQTAAANVVIMTVQTATGPWVENSEGGLEVQVTATGIRAAGGHAQRGGHHRHLEPSALTTPATLTAANGAPITLQPGNTWEELVPAGITVTPAAAPAPAPATASGASSTTTKPTS